MRVIYDIHRTVLMYTALYYTHTVYIGGDLPTDSPRRHENLTFQQPQGQYNLYNTISYNTISYKYTHLYNKYIYHF